MFVGRKDILDRLDGLWRKSTPSLVTVRGRRRIGKSTLVEQFARQTADHFISIEGQAPGKGVNNKLQLRSFVEQLSAQTNAPDVPVANWFQAFQLLANALPQGGRVVVLLDEISWMGGYDVGFAGTLKTAWDSLSRRGPTWCSFCAGAFQAGLPKTSSMERGSPDATRLTSSWRSFRSPTASRFGES